MQGRTFRAPQAGWRACLSPLHSLGLNPPVSRLRPLALVALLLACAASEAASKERTGDRPFLRGICFTANTFERFSEKELVALVKRNRVNLVAVDFFLIGHSYGWTDMAGRNSSQPTAMMARKCRRNAPAQGDRWESHCQRVCSSVAVAPGTRRVVARNPFTVHGSA